MPEAFLGDGLVYEETMPVIWTAGPLAEGLALSRDQQGRKRPPPSMAWKTIRTECCACA